MLKRLALSPHSKKVLGLIPGSGPVSARFACSPCVRLGSLRSPKRVTLIGHSRLSECELFVSICVIPATNWQPVQDDPASTK